MIKKYPSLALTRLGVLLAAVCSLHAEDWPQWGGNDPGRNMYSPAKGMPATFEPGKFKKNSEDIDLATTKNVKWIAKLGSQTYGNPVVIGGKVLVGTNNAVPRDERFKDDRSILMCFDEYRQLYLAAQVPKLASGKSMTGNILALSSPTVEGDSWLFQPLRSALPRSQWAGEWQQGPFQTKASIADPASRRSKSRRRMPTCSGSMT
jgi:hypothetical protein